MGHHTTLPVSAPKTFPWGFVLARRIVERSARGLRGGRFKDYEDRLDAILCAYVAAHYWTWGTRRCAIVGTLEGGYIVTPMTPEIARQALSDARIFVYACDPVPRMIAKPGRPGDLKGGGVI